MRRPKKSQIPWLPDILQPQIKSSSEKKFPYSFELTSEANTSWPPGDPAPITSTGLWTQYSWRKESIKNEFEIQKPEIRITEKPGTQQNMNPVRAMKTMGGRDVGVQDFWQFKVNGFGKLNESLALPMWWEIYHGRLYWCQAVPGRPP